MARYKLILGSLALLIGLGITSYAQDDNNTHLGTWVLTVTPPAGGPPAFQALASFASGGVFIASTQNDHAVPSAGIQQGTCEGRATARSARLKSVLFTARPELPSAP